MSKREDDSQPDIEVGMTTAERRRRRRRGAGLRVPSDNVPRRSTPPVAAPVPEDPSLAMSIAYSFTSDASQPVPVPADSAAQTYPDPAAPEPISTVIDPPSAPVEQADFEMKTREMSAVDLESLGLSELQGRTVTDRDAVPRGELAASDGRAHRAVHVEPRAESSQELDVDIADVEESGAIPAAALSPAPAAAPVYRRERLRTVALSDEDLEEVREAVRAMEQTQTEAAAAVPAGQGVVASPMSHVAPGAMAAAPHAPAGQGPLPTAAAAQTPLAQAHAHAPLAQPHTPLTPQGQPPLGATSGQIPLTAAPLQAQAASSQAQSVSHATPPRPPPTPPHGLSTVPRPHTPTPAPPVAVRDTRSAADDMWGENTPVPRPAPQDAPRAEALPRAETVPSVATPPAPAPAAAAPTPAPAPRPISFPPPNVDHSNRTQPLSPLDLELPDEARSAEDSGGVPVIDLQGTASGEFEVDVDADDDAEEIPPVTAPAEAPRARTPSTPPPAAAGSTGQMPVVSPAQAAAAAAAAPAPSGTPSGQFPAAAPAAGGAGTAAPAATKDPHHGHAHPPPPPAAALHHHAKPPAPPPPAKKDSAAKPAAAAASSSSAPATSRTATDTRLRAKPWFVEVFDEDYLRTLPFLTPQATQSEAEFVANAMGITPGQQVLDVGCGYGRHAMELAARGFHVVGLDLSTPLLLRGGEEAQRRGLQINFIRGDMRELDYDSQFDGAYCLFSTFGYFDDETNKRTIANIARALKPGGRILLEILNRDYVITDLPTRVWWEGDGCVVLEEVELNYFSSRIQVNRSVVFDDGRQVEQEISIRAYSLHEVGKLMHAAGFRVLEVSGGYQTRGRFFGNQSRHIIVLAERKEPAAS